MGLLAYLSAGLLGCLLVGPFVDGVQAVDCPDHWINYKGHCYNYRPELLTWKEAEAQCNASGAHLASMNSAQEQKAIAKYLSQNAVGQDVWLGLSMTERCYWDWSDNTFVLYTAWGEPEGTFDLRDMHCAVLGQSSGFSKWNHKYCSDKHAFICELDPSAPEVKAQKTPTTHSLQAGEQDVECPFNTFMYNDHCYDYTEQKMNWEQAEGQCRKMGGHLLSLNYEQEHKFIATQLTRKSFSEDVWLGFSVTKETCNWDWSDNSLAMYTAWGDVTDDLRNKHCAVLGGSSSFMKWNHRSCSDKHAFICKMTPQALTKAFQDMEETTPLPRHTTPPPQIVNLHHE